MTLRGLLASALAIVTAAACGSSVTMPSATTPPTTPTTAVTTTTSGAGVTGLWRGTATDSQGLTTVLWSLTQTGTNVSGTVRTNVMNPEDGSCSSCHRNKSGTFTGSIAGMTLTLTMHFAAGADGDPTPACTTTLSGSALISGSGSNQLVAAYTGADSCEGPFLNGNLPMTRQP